MSTWRRLTLGRWIFRPRALFFAKYPDGAVVGKAQKAPELLPWLQTFADESGNMGRYLLTGSQNLAIAKNISKSLAGRVANLTLLPFGPDGAGDTPLYSYLAQQTYNWNLQQNQPNFPYRQAKQKAHAAANRMGL